MMLEVNPVTIKPSTVSTIMSSVSEKPARLRSERIRVGMGSGPWSTWKQTLESLPAGAAPGRPRHAVGDGDGGVGGIVHDIAFRDVARHLLNDAALRERRALCARDLLEAGVGKGRSESVAPRLTERTSDTAAHSDDTEQSDAEDRERHDQFDERDATPSAFCVIALTVLHGHLARMVLPSFETHSESDMPLAVCVKRKTWEAACGDTPRGSYSMVVTPVGAVICTP